MNVVLVNHRCSSCPVGQGYRQLCLYQKTILPGSDPFGLKLCSAGGSLLAVSERCGLPRVIVSYPYRAVLTLVECSASIVYYCNHVHSHFAVFLGCSLSDLVCVCACMSVPSSSVFHFSPGRGSICVRRQAPHSLQQLACSAVISLRCESHPPHWEARCFVKVTVSPAWVTLCIVTPKCAVSMLMQCSG